MKFPTISTDERGETSFGIQDVTSKELAVGPPPNPLGNMCDVGRVESMCIVSFSAGTVAAAHTAPQPYVVIVLSGEGEVETSNGESRRFGPGDLIFCNDLTGKGHITRATTDLTLAFINRVAS